MSEKTFSHSWTNVDGGPCPSCGHSGLLFAANGVYRQTAVLRHLDAFDVVQECTVPMSWGRIVVSPDGVWSFEACHD